MRLVSGATSRTTRVRSQPFGQRSRRGTRPSLGQPDARSPRRSTQARARSARPGYPGPSPLTLFRKMGSRWFLGKLLAVAIALGAFWTVQELGSSPNFEATTALVSGNDLVSAEEIVNTLNIGRPNVFWLRARQLASQLERLSAVQKVAIQPSLSGNIYVHVTERVPVAVWESAGQEILVDADGIALREGSRELPVLHAIGAGPFPVGSQLDFSAVQVVQAISPRLPALGLAEARLEWDPTAGVSILNETLRITLGNAEQIDAKLEAYRAIQQRLSQARIPAQLIDVRSLDRPYFR